MAFHTSQVGERIHRFWTCRQSTMRPVAGRLASRDGGISAALPWRRARDRLHGLRATLNEAGILVQKMACPTQSRHSITAEVAILNKSAVALAADSAVTIGGGSGNPKIFNTVNKVFTLSK